MAAYYYTSYDDLVLASKLETKPRCQCNCVCTYPTRNEDRAISIHERGPVFERGHDRDDAGKRGDQNPRRSDYIRNGAGRFLVVTQKPAEPGRQSVGGGGWNDEVEVLVDVVVGFAEDAVEVGVDMLGGGGGLGQCRRHVC